MRAYPVPLAKPSLHPLGPFPASETAVIRLLSATANDINTMCKVIESQPRSLTPSHLLGRVRIVPAPLSTPPPVSRMSRPDLASLTPSVTSRHLRPCLGHRRRWRDPEKMLGAAHVGSTLCLISKFGSRRSRSCFPSAPATGDPDRIHRHLDLVWNSLDVLHSSHSWTIPKFSIL